MRRLVHRQGCDENYHQQEDLGEVEAVQERLNISPTRVRLAHRVRRVRLVPLVRPASVSFREDSGTNVLA